MNQPQEILVRAPNWTGDWIMATPGFRALRARWPEARITLQVRPGLEPLAAGAPWFDDVIPVPSYGHGLAAQLRDARALRRRRYDLGLCLPDSFSAAWLMRLGGVRRIVGYRRGWRRLLLHQAVPLPAGKPGAGGRLMLARELHVLGLVEAAGAPPRGTHLELHATAEEETEARRALHEAGLPEGAAYAVLAPGASYGPSKCWPAESFAVVGDALAAAGSAIVVVGTAAESALVRRVVEHMKRPALALAGKLSLGGLKPLLRDAGVLVCNDAGARHVGVAFGVPCVVLLGSTALEKTDLNLDRVKVLTADVHCRPCYLRECPIDHRCMTRIPPELVAEQALPALARDAARDWQGDQLLVRDGRIASGGAPRDGRLASGGAPRDGRLGSGPA